MNRILSSVQSGIGIPLNSGIKPQFLEWKSKFHTFACNLTLLTEKGNSFATAHTFCASRGGTRNSHFLRTVPTYSKLIS